MTPDQISDFIGVQPDEAVAKGGLTASSTAGRPYKWTLWKLVERGGSSTDTSQLINALYERILPIVNDLKKLRHDTGCEIIFQVVLHHSPTDAVGPGFDLDVPLLKVLVDIGATVDVDQYIIADG